MNSLVETGFPALACTDPLPPARHRAIVRHMALEGCKWDPQIGDVATLADYAVVLSREEWTKIVAMTEALATELLAVESALTQRTDLWPQLGLPRRIRRALASDEPWTPTAARAMRFDFHPTAEGWTLSEVNSDVPGGYNEASLFTTLMAEEISGAQPAGDPLAALADALAQSCGSIRRVALVAAPGYADDQQVTAGLAAALRARGCETMLVGPAQVSWKDGYAQVADTLPVGTIFRFYQGEWLTRLSGDAWQPYFRGGLTPVCNPASAVLTESKRLPLLWEKLGVPVPTWRRHLPDSAAALRALSGDEWVLKGAYSNTGDAVLSRAWGARRGLVGALAEAVLRPHDWIAQRRFISQAIATPEGPRHLCLGVYVLDGAVTGIYARISSQLVIDYTAQDVAVLIAN